MFQHTQDTVVCDDCKRNIARQDAIQQKGLVFCKSKAACLDHVMGCGGRGQRKAKLQAV